MAKIRPQYHLRRTGSGIDAWSVRRLIELSRDMPVFTVAPESFSELDEDHWYFHDTDLLPTPNSLIEHMKIINTAKLDHPIILDEAGRVMDGMHRICKAILQEVPEISAVQFQADPAPDFVNCNPKELPYDA